MGGSRAALIALAGVAFLATPAAASGATMELEGPGVSDSPEPTTHLITDYDGHAISGRIKWEAKCIHTKAFVHFQTRFRIPPDRQEVGAFATSGHYSVRGHGFRIKFRVRMTGRELVDPISGLPSRDIYRWGGNFNGVARFRYRGRFIDQCSARHIGWEAHRELHLDPAGTGRLQMTSDPGDPFGSGATFSYLAPPDSLIADGYPTASIIAQSGGFELEFFPPDGTTWTTRRYTGVKLGQQYDGSPGMRLIGNGRYCNSISGEFTINSLAFDRWKALREADISFIQYCNGSSAPLHGTLTYRRSIDAP
jgi:hypothetical protein